MASLSCEDGWWLLDAAGRLLAADSPQTGLPDKAGALMDRYHIHSRTVVHGHGDTELVRQIHLDGSDGGPCVDERCLRVHAIVTMEQADAPPTG